MYAGTLTKVNLGPVIASDGRERGNYNPPTPPFRKGGARFPPLEKGEGGISRVASLLAMTGPIGNFRLLKILENSNEAVIYSG